MCLVIQVKSCNVCILFSWSWNEICLHLISWLITNDAPQTHFFPNKWDKPCTPPPTTHTHTLTHSHTHTHTHTHTHKLYSIATVKVLIIHQSEDTCLPSSWFRLSATKAMNNISDCQQPVGTQLAVAACSVVMSAIAAAASSVVMSAIAAAACNVVMSAIAAAACSVVMSAIAAAACSVVMSAITELAGSSAASKLPAVITFGVATHRSQLKAHPRLVHNTAHSATGNVARSLLHLSVCTYGQAIEYGHHLFICLCIWAC